MLSNTVVTEGLPSMGLDLQSSFIEALGGLGLGPGLARLLWLPLPMLLVLVAAVVGVLVNVWLERKISAAAQQRIGPEYAGALGLLQPMADGLKLLFKEDIIPARADGLLFTLGPVLVLVPVILSWLVVPFGQNLLISNVGVGIFLWIALSSIQPIGLLMSGYASNNKYSLLGGLRAAAQSISYEIPLALAVLAIVMMSNSLSTVDIVNQQTEAGILSWNIWRQPIGFVIFWICALAECERLPFDRVLRHEVRPVLFGQLHQSCALGPAGFGSLPRRLGFSRPCRMAGELDGSIGGCPPGPVDHRCRRHRHDYLQGLPTGVLRHPFALDRAPGSYRSAFGSRLEVPAAHRFGESPDYGCPQTGFPLLFRRLKPREASNSAIMD
jgi:hypothetical protein